MTGGSMTKAELVEEVSRVSDLTKKHSEVIVDTVFRSIIEALHRGEKIELRGFGSFRLPSGTPIASLYAIIPLSGVLIALFTIEQLVNGIRNGFDHPEPPEEELPIPPVDIGGRAGTRP